MKNLRINTSLFEELVKAKKGRNGNSMKIGDFLLDRFKLYSLWKFNSDDKDFYIELSSIDEKKSTRIPELINIINDIDTLSKNEYIKLEEGINQLLFGEWIKPLPPKIKKTKSGGIIESYIGLLPNIKDEDLKMWKIINSYYEIVMK